MKDFSFKLNQPTRSEMAPNFEASRKQVAAQQAKDNALSKKVYMAPIKAYGTKSKKG
jgi:hypothetical protein